MIWTVLVLFRFLCKFDSHAGYTSPIVCDESVIWSSWHILQGQTFFFFSLRQSFVNLILRYIVGTWSRMYEILVYVLHLNYVNHKLSMKVKYSHLTLELYLGCFWLPFYLFFFPLNSIHNLAGLQSCFLSFVCFNGSW